MHIISKPSPIPLGILNDPAVAGEVYCVRAFPSYTGKSAGKDSFTSLKRLLTLSLQVESGFKRVGGVGNVSVSLVMERAVVMHDPQMITAEKIQEIIEDRGFNAEVLATDIPSPMFDRRGYLHDDADEGEDVSGITTTTLAVVGMTCGACTSAVEGGFKDVPGVKHFSISLLSERAVVEHDTSILSTEQISEIIEDRGFGATIIESTMYATTNSLKTRRGSSGRKEQVATTTVAIEGMTCGMILNLSTLLSIC